MKWISRLFSFLVGPKEEDPAEDLADFSQDLEHHLNNVALSLGRLKGQERYLRLELETTLTKVDTIAKRLEALPESEQASREQLAAMHQKYARDALRLGQRLEQAEAQCRTVDDAYAELRKEVGDLRARSDVLGASLDTALARQKVYGNCNLETASPGAGLESLSQKVMELEAQANATLACHRRE